MTRIPQSHAGPTPVPVPDLHAREEFTHDGYRRFLRALKDAGYEFCDFGGGLARLKAAPQERIVFLRHDIDFDMGIAAQMARIEAEEGVRASYFFMLRTPHYNMFTAENQHHLKTVMDCGQHIGLHFDCAAYDDLDTKGKIQYHCNLEAQMLSTLADRKVEVVSFHRPNDLVLSSDADLTHPLLHTYASFFFKDIYYCSDSRGVWRYGHPLESEAFKSRKPLHILIHPIWWTKAARMPLEALADYLDHKDDELRVSMAANCVIYPYKGVNE